MRYPKSLVNLGTNCGGNEFTSGRQIHFVKFEESLNNKLMQLIDCTVVSSLRYILEGLPVFRMIDVPTFAFRDFELDLKGDYIAERDVVLLSGMSTFGFEFSSSREVGSIRRWGWCVIEESERGCL